MHKIGFLMTNFWIKKILSTKMMMTFFGTRNVLQKVSVLKLKFYLNFFLAIHSLNICLCVYTYVCICMVYEFIKLLQTIGEKILISLTASIISNLLHIKHSMGPINNYE